MELRREMEGSGGQEMAGAGVTRAKQNLWKLRWGRDASDGKALRGPEDKRISWSVEADSE